DTFLSGIHPDDKYLMHQIVKNSLHTDRNRILHTEYRVIGIVDKKERWLSSHAKIIFDRSGKPVRFIGTTQDITDRKKAELEIARLERERKSMLSMFAHDIKNAIVPSVWLLNGIISGKSQDPGDNLAEIRESLTTAERLLANFIDFSRFETKKYIPAKVSFDMEAAIRTQIGNLKARAEEKNITISCIFPETPFP